MDRLQEIRGKYQTICELDHNSFQTAAMIDFLFSRPFLFLRQASESLSIHFKTAQEYFLKLIQADVLRKIIRYARIRIFQVEDEILREVQGNDVRSS